MICARPRNRFVHAKRLQVLEEQKSALDPTDPRVERLSEEIERLARALQGKTAAERELSHEISAAG